MAGGASSPSPGIALYDLDGTLLAWDCQLLFRHHVTRREPWRAVFLPVYLAFLPLAGVLGIEGLKRVFLSYLAGMDRGTLDAHARDFARSLMPAIYPELRATLAEHRRAGHVLILSSASPEFYVREIGRELGFDHVFGTEIEETGRMPFFPELVNHKGEEKVRRLRRELPESWFRHSRLVRCHGYTDSTADLPMLALCGSATVVNPGRALAEIAARASWEVVRPRRPWRSAAGRAWRTLALLTGLGRDPGGLGVQRSASVPAISPKENPG